MIENIAVLIPSLDPDERLLGIVGDLIRHDFTRIIVVDDGSSASTKIYFDKLKDLSPLLHAPRGGEGVYVFRHYVNMGKGRSIKDAFNYILCNFEDIKGVVTADSDGQHSVEDIKKCCEILEREPDDAKTLILGCRNFDDEGVPFKSRFGNKLTRIVLGGLCGVNVTDTQTGLRGFTKKAMECFLDTSGERFEYETNMLIECPQKSIAIKQYPIETIYINEGGKVRPHRIPCK